MRNLIVAEHISLDGVIQAPGGPDEDPSDGFRFGGWTVPFVDKAIGNAIVELHARPFELLLGRRTYDIWAPYWPTVPEGNPIADPFNRTIKHVATHRPESLEWRNSQAIHGDLAQAVQTLKDQAGDDLMTWGSGEVVRQLLAAGLVDEFFLVVYPVVLGHGKRLFPDDSVPTTFKLVDSLRSESGVVLNRLIRGGDVVTGSFS